MGVQEVLIEGFNLFKKQFVTFVIATVIVVFGSLFIITAPPLTFGLYYMAVRAVQGEEVSIGDVFKGFNYFILSWTLGILMGLAVVVGFILLIIPGILLFFVLQYAIPIAISEGKGAVDSLKRSYEIGMKNLGFTIVLGLMLWIINTIGGSVALGSLITLPYMMICFSLAAIRLKEGALIATAAPLDKGAPVKKEAPLYQLLNELIGIEIDSRRIQDENQKKIAGLHDNIAKLLEEKREANEQVLEGIRRLEDAIGEKSS